MKKTPLPEAQPKPGRRVAIGTFDGVHLGHREVIRDNDTVLTFDPHPLAVVRPGAEPKLLCPPGVKADLIAGLGVEELVTIPFDREFSSKTPEQFVQEVLVDRLGAEHVSVGENFRFGKKQAGDAEFLQSRPEFETRVVPLVEVDGEIVSSSHVRGVVGAGEVDKGALFPGGPFLFEGVVVEGDRRGRELGMPTANIVPDDRFATPGHGVYAAWAHGHPAAVNVGVGPAFDTGRGLLVETHLLDFDGDLYGQTLRVAFLGGMGGEMRFDAVDDLVAEMRVDGAEAGAIASATFPRR